MMLASIGKWYGNAVVHLALVVPRHFNSKRTHLTDYWKPRSPNKNVWFSPARRTWRIILPDASSILMLATL